MSPPVQGQTKNLTTEQRADLVKSILVRNDPFRCVSQSGPNRLSQGCMVVTGWQAGVESAEQRFGYCVQVRKGVGQFGSDLVFLRHPDGRLVTHENQSFILMTPEQQALARPLFMHLPEDEDFSQGYTCVDKVHEVGFLVEGSTSKPMPNTPFAIRIMEAER